LAKKLDTSFQAIEFTRTSSVLRRPPAEDGSLKYVSGFLPSVND
jgi:hypothetical protein